MSSFEIVPEPSAAERALIVAALEQVADDPYDPPSIWGQQARREIVDDGIA